MYIPIVYNKHWKLKPRKKKGGLKPTLRKSLKKWLKKNKVPHYTVLDGPNSGIILKAEDKKIFEFKLRW